MHPGSWSTLLLEHFGGRQGSVSVSFSWRRAWPSSSSSKACRQLSSLSLDPLEASRRHIHSAQCRCHRRAYHAAAWRGASGRRASFLALPASSMASSLEVIQRALRTVRSHTTPSGGTATACLAETAPAWSAAPAMRGENTRIHLRRSPSALPYGVSRFQERFGLSCDPLRWTSPRKRDWLKISKEPDGGKQFRQFFASCLKSRRP